MAKKENHLISLKPSHPLVISSEPGNGLQGELKQVIYQPYHPTSLGYPPVVISPMTG
jgi:hypothetical protein